MITTSYQPRLNMLSALVASCVALAACGGGTEDVIDTLEQAQGKPSTRSIDTTPPSVAVSSQSTVDSAGLVSIAGQATDNKGVKQVTWVNSLGGSGTTTLSGSSTSVTWSAAGVQLQVGDNTLTFTAQDGAGNKSSTSVVISRAATADAPAISATPTSPSTATATPIAAPLTALPNTLRQVYVDPANPAAADTNNGTFTAPLKTLSAAMKILRAGDDVIVGAGTFRETVTLPSLAGSTYTTAIRAAVPGTATVKGSDEVTGWTQVSADTWSISWAGSEPEQVYRNGAQLQQIAGTVFRGFPTVIPSGMFSDSWPGRIAGDKSTLTPDSFTYDSAEKKIYVRLSSPLASGEALEVSTRTYALFGSAAIGVVVDGMNFMHANTSLTQRHGAVYLIGSGATIRNSTIRYMDSFCVMVSGDDSKLLNSTVEYCGQAGVAAYGARVTVSGNRVAYNNTRGFNPSWEAGGMKFTGTPALTDSTISNNIAVYNSGDGIWFDSTPRRVVVEGNVSAYNNGHGIHFEASQYGTFRNNQVYGNGKRGIYLLESSYSTVTGNVAFANTLQGIAALNGVRSATNSALLPYANSIVSNTVAWNDARGNRIQFMLPGLTFANTSDLNRSHATDVTPRYSEGDVTSTNPYAQGLSNWRALSGQDAGSQESFGAMPDALATALGARQLLKTADLPTILQKAGV